MPYGIHPRIRRFVGVFLAMLASLCLIGGSLPPAQAQFSRLWVPDMLEAGEQANFFVKWDGKESLDGLRLHLPEGWRLRHAVALPENRLSHIPLAVRDAGGNDGYRIAAPSRLRGPHQFVLQIEAGRSLGTFDWSLLPFVVGGAGNQAQERAVAQRKLTRKIMLEPEPPRGNNLALRLDERASPLPLPDGLATAIAPGASFTIEFWVQTVRLGSVVLSTWDGDPNRPYPLELVVDPRGHLLWYWGRPGLHRSLASARPIADGAWHHVAVVHDNPAGAYRLLLDGVATDSIFAPDPPFPVMPLAPTLGGRAGAPVVEPAPQFVGMIDEMRFWSYARTPADIKQAMRVHRDSGRDLLAIGFDSERTFDQLAGLAPGMVQPAPGLAFYYPVQSLRATADVHSATLSWTTESPQEQTFVIERSTDGRSFLRVGSVQVSASEARLATGLQRYSFRDLSAPADVPVWYYRIRQRLADGIEQTTGVIKIGRGEAKESAARLIGTSPNPFNGTTIIHYEVVQAQPVSLSVWDVSGQLVDLLVQNETREPGAYQVRFDAGDLPSGIYFARLVTPQGAQTTKMLLMK